jgi:putative oxidoreductase
MFSKIKEILCSAGLLWLRVGAGAGIATHGYGKVFGGHMEKFAGGVAEMGFPMPEVFAWAAALSEFLGGILLVLGLGTRPAAFFVLMTMSVAFFIRHRLDPFKVKELAFLYWTMSGALVLTGSGAFSLDGLLFKKKS